MVLWMLGIAVSVSALVITAAKRVDGVHMAYLHMAIAAGVSLLFAAYAIRECRELVAAGAPPAAIAGNNARYMGLVWAWGALALVVTYGTGVLVWKEWWHFFLAFFAAACLCLYFAATLKKDAPDGGADERTLRWSRTLAIAQLVGMVVTMLGLLIDGKMVRFYVPRYTDWAANNIFFFGAMAIAAISGYALKHNKHA